MNLPFASLLLLALYIAVPYAGNVPVKKILLTYTDDFAVKAQDERTAFIKKGSYPGIPMVDDIEFRVRDKSYDINQIRYEIRLQPRGIGETRAARRYNDAVSKGYDFKAQVRRDQALRERYFLVLDLLEQERSAEGYQELKILYEDKIKVLEKKQFDQGFDLNFLIDAEDKNTKAQVLLYDLKRSAYTAKRSLASYLAVKDVDGVDTTGFVNIDSVIATIETTRYSFDTNTIYLSYFRSQLQIAAARYDLEKAESRKYISFLGFSYDNGQMLDELTRRDDGKSYDLHNAYALELGIKIPDLTMARHDIARRQDDYLSEKEDYERLKQELSGQMKKDIEDLRSLIAQYRFLKARENEVDATASLKKYLQMSGVEPLALLSIKESIIKNQLERSKLEFSILRNYVRVVDAAGDLSKPPLRNFLSQSREPIQP